MPESDDGKSKERRASEIALRQIAEMMTDAKGEWCGRRRVATVAVENAYSVDMRQLSFPGAMMQYGFHALKS
ncbi:hypothetical protein [Neorhizobium sp. T7_12]|uniref:hypothetical protein n=1 Tax=Neorhizobium sp. T7_12 TaxID=2093832 RepID=UPI000CFA6FE0|nr:hypothetical protein [Neorhizobium sp. T7_12]